MVTSIDCSECHNTQRWSQVSFTHSSPLYPGDHRSSVGCKDCHRGNTEQATWTAGAYKPDCAGCHASDWKDGPHKKHENPDRKYSISELRDCAGSCHIYTDSSLTTIKKRRSGEHRVNGGDF
jgi:hypothetical protein